MDKTKTYFTVLGSGIAIGAVLVVLIIFGLEIRPKNVKIGGVEFEIPTVTPDDSTSNSIISNPTSNPSSSLSDLSTIPVIDSIDFPQVIVCDGRRYDALIYFHDSDGNASRILYALVYSKKQTRFTSEPINLSFSSQNQITGAVLSDYVEWHTTGDEVTIKVIIEDTAGQSSSKEYKFKCSY